MKVIHKWLTVREGQYPVPPDPNKIKATCSDCGEETTYAIDGVAPGFGYPFEDRK